MRVITSRGKMCNSDDHVNYVTQKCIMDGQDSPVRLPVNASQSQDNGLSEDPQDHSNQELHDFTMTTSRSLVPAQFRRQSTPSIYDPGGSSLHINPRRTRTPRPQSTVPKTFLLDEVETQIFPSSDVTTQDVTAQDSEKIPLIRSTEREEAARSGKSHQKTLSELCSCFQCPLKDATWRRKFFRGIKIIFLFTITILCCTSTKLSHDSRNQGSELATPPHKQTVALNKAVSDTSSPIASSTNCEANLTSYRDVIACCMSTDTMADNLCSDDSSYIRLQIRGPFYETDLTNDTGPSFQIGLNTEIILDLKVNQTASYFDDSFQFSKDIKCCRNGNCSIIAATSLPVPVSWYTRELSWHVENEVIYAFMVLGFVYILIIFELVHRTLAALLGALAALAVLSALNERPTLITIMRWLDMDTLTLLFGMMIIVGIFAETGFFDYSALMAYKLAKGKIWPLITLLCVFSAVVSAFLDNVTTILLVAPVTIRLCEVLNLEPQRILIAEVLFSNIGGTATAIGDPPNVIIVGALSNRGITFTSFTLHAFPGIIVVSFVGYALLRLYYRNMDELKNKDPHDISEMKHEVATWKRAAGRIQVVTREETIMRALFMQKAVEIEHTLNKTLHKRKRDESQDLKDTIRKLESQYCIKDFPLLIKSGLIVFAVIIFLFMYSFVSSIYLDIGWIAVLGALWLLVLADVEDFDGVLHKVEWSTLLFFASLFILMEALAELGMIKTIGDGIADVIVSVDESHRLLLAMFIILWVSAISSSFIDNIPYTTAMVPVLVQLCDDPQVNLPLVPLVVALAFGACLGGNGTLIGASCNVVCAGIAEQHGYGFSFWQFFKIGFPMMLVTTLASTGYVLLCHVAMEWNYS